jgi:hypothetical protein
MDIYSLGMRNSVGSTLPTQYLLENRDDVPAASFLRLVVDGAKVQARGEAMENAKRRPCNYENELLEERCNQW